LSLDLTEGGRGGSTGVSRRRLRSGLVVGEIALSVMLLVGAGVMIQTLFELMRQSLGFDPQHVLTVDLDLSTARYKNPDQQAAFFRKAMEGVKTLPGVEAAAATSDLPDIYGSGRVSFRLEGQSYPSKQQEPWTHHYVVSPDYFRAMRIPQIKGRDFLPTDDAKAPLVVVVSRNFVERFFPHEEPVGRRIFVDTGQAGPQVWSEIVGVVGDVRDWVGQPTFAPELYECYLQRPPSSMTLVVRAQSDPATLASSVRRTIWSVDKDQPIGALQTLRHDLDDAAAGDWLISELLGGFAALALILAAVGIFGVISYNVSQRTREVGIRMALGAQAGDVLRLVVGNGAFLTALGVAIGLVGAYPLPRALEGAFVGLQVNAGLILAVSSLLVAAVALVASYVPARRATQVDPMVALRYE
jgi:putative ABC transport system permease protein